MPMRNSFLGAFTACICVLGAVCAAPVSAASDAAIPAAQARQVVAEFMQAVNSLHAQFEQTLQDETGEILETEAGELWLQRPGKFRWRYSEPAEREIVADPENIWLYDAELDQVTVRPIENAVAESPAALLVGNVAALDDYTFSGQRAADGMVRVMLVPRKANGDFKSIELGFAAGDLALLELSDRFGPQIPASVFDFILPDGADVIDQRKK
jgi:outer membrane lipoprotein carrier protein